MTTLPAITVAKVREGSALLQRMARENTSVFLDAQADYASEHRARHTRPLTGPEAAQVAVAMAEQLDATDPTALAVAVQGSDLRAYDDPTPVEMLVVAGLETAPAFLRLALAFLALVEMPTDVFAAARAEDDALQAALDAAVAALEDEDVEKVRERAQAAMQHFADKTGSDVGKVRAALVRTVLGPLQEALRASTRSQPSSLISSAPSTPASDETTSSTASHTGTSSSTPS